MQRSALVAVLCGESFFDEYRGLYRRMPSACEYSCVRDVLECVLRGGYNEQGVWARNEVFGLGGSFAKERGGVRGGQEEVNTGKLMWPGVP